MSNQGYRAIIVALSLAASASFANEVRAAYTVSGSTGSGSSLRSASVTFDISGSDLCVTLTNTANTDVMVPIDVLTAVFFDISGGAVALTRTSGMLDGGSVVMYDPDGQPAGSVIGGEWAYKSALVGGPGNRSYGVSSTGLGLFGPGDRFPGADLQSPASPDGLQYGLLSAGDNSATGNGGVTGSGGLIMNSVKFTLGGAGSNFDLSRIHNIWFQYGTDLSEPGFPGVPEPATLALLVGGAIMMKRRRAA